MSADAAIAIISRHPANRLLMAMALLYREIIRIGVMHAELVGKLGQLAQALAEGPRKGMFRCEDMISAAAAFAGECCLRKSAVIDFDHHDFAPGKRIFSDRINDILSGDRASWKEIPITSTFGTLYNALTHSEIPHGIWDHRLFPEVTEIYQQHAAAGGSTPWGYVPLTVAPMHAPKMPPLRAAFELRRLAFANLTPDFPKPNDLLAISQFLLMKVLMKTRPSINEAVAIRLTFETLNGMAKTAPVLPKHMQEFATKATAGS
jgi:hypothetical protein